MKRMTLIAAALCLVMIATVGAGAVAAKQTENPRQAGASPIYFYDVSPAPDGTHGTGKLQINVDQHTFEFNGKDFTPSAQIELKARAVDSTDYKVFATGKATAAGNVHIAGTWEAGAAPAEVLGSCVQISGFRLTNDGSFVAQLACDYSTDNGWTWQESYLILVRPGEHFQTTNLLYDLGVRPPALVKIHVVALEGGYRTADRIGSEVFPYPYPTDSSQYPVALYTISGEAWGPVLVYQGTVYGI